MIKSTKSKIGNVLTRLKESKEEVESVMKTDYVYMENLPQHILYESDDGQLLRDRVENEFSLVEKFDELIKLTEIIFHQYS